MNTRAPKIRIGVSHINPLSMQPNKVGISLIHAYAYVLFGSPKYYPEARNLTTKSHDPKYGVWKISP